MKNKIKINSKQEKKPCGSFFFLGLLYLSFTNLNGNPCFYLISFITTYNISYMLYNLHIIALIVVSCALHSWLWCFLLIICLAYVSLIDVFIFIIYIDCCRDMGYVVLC